MGSMVMMYPARPFSFPSPFCLPSLPEQLLESHFPKQASGLIISHGALALSPCAVQWTGRGEMKLGFSSLVRAKQHEKEFENKQQKLLEFISLLNSANLNAKLSENIIEDMWNKLIVNACVNPIGALFEEKNGELLHSVVYQQMIKKLSTECVSVCQANNISISKDIEEKINNVLRNTKENRCSMLQDIQNGKETEIDYLNGAIIKYGRKAGVSVQAHEKVFSAVKRKQSEPGFKPSQTFLE
eukprot:TRINITY_DN808_c0_g2_i1.p1 TRINITY_DN808_c0_g2~~TRINITY_DN808_c0_g2_i1.p1  ORF type:complete len:242 (+),score=39.26 TRINITY_DN808_c0_g2_i1:477-1202(+)